MNIQIFGKSKCFDTKKAERYFKERRIKYQMVDLVRYGMSKGEFTSVCRAVGLEAMIDPKAKDPDAAMLPYLASDEAAYVTGQIVNVDGGLNSHVPTVAQFRQMNSRTW